ncbi:MAG: hypothetical protein M1839_003768 [Geoglossum umbratile]|nr:MAG: hypothetical protein M1839_003768 [Geoglossum umbratile]
MNRLDKDTGNSQPTPSYQSRVASLCTKFPHLSHLSNFLRSNARYPLGRIVCLEFPDNNGSAEPMTARQLTLTELPDLIRPKEGGPICNQILIVEDLTKEVIKILGSGLSIDPAFFASHLNSSRIDDMDPSTCQIKVLPSVRNREDFVTINFIIPIILDHSPPAKFKCCSNVQRIVLVDPPLTNSFVYDDPHRDHTSGPYFSEVRLFGGGYIDCSGSSRDVIRESLPGKSPAKCSTLEDLVYYWAKELPPAFDTATGDLPSLSYYAFKIATGEYMAFANCMRHTAEKYSYHLESGSRVDLKALELDLIFLQTRKRCTRTVVSHMRRALGDIKRWRANPHHVWNSVKEDYEFLIDTLTSDDRRLDSMVTVVAALLQVLESRRSVQETISLTRLTYLTLFFVPPGFVAALFGMSGDVAPGLPRFWVYLAVAIPVTVLTFGVTMYFRWFWHYPEMRPRGVPSTAREKAPPTTFLLQRIVSFIVSSV